MTKKDFIAVADGLIEFIKLHGFSLNLIDSLINSVAPKLEQRGTFFSKEKFREYIISKI
jgi:hypothetical protein